MGKAFDGCYSVFAFINNAFWGTLFIIAGVFGMFWERNFLFGVVGIGIGIYFFWRVSWTRKTVALIAGKDSDESAAQSTEPIAAVAPPGSVSQRKMIAKKVLVFAAIAFLYLGARGLNFDEERIGASTIIYGGLALASFFVYARTTLHRATEDAVPAPPWGPFVVAVLTAAFSPNTRPVRAMQEDAAAVDDGRPVAVTPEISRELAGEATGLDGTGREDEVRPESVADEWPDGRVPVGGSVRAEPVASEKDLEHAAKVRTPTVGGLVRGIVVIVLVVGGAAGVYFGSAASSNRRTAAESKGAEAERLAAAERAQRKDYPSSSERGYSQYLSSLTPAQVALRKSLDPDRLAELEDAQITEEFAIPAGEVSINGAIDPALCAEAFAARMQGIYNGGISDREYSKWGGHDSFGISTIDEVSRKYCELGSTGLLGEPHTLESGRYYLRRGETTDSMMRGLRPRPIERYHLRVFVEPGSVSSAIGEDGSIDIRFTGHLTDNWDEIAMDWSFGGDGDKQTNSTATWSIEGIHVTEAGVVVPTRAVIPGEQSWQPAQGG